MLVYASGCDSAYREGGGRLLKRTCSGSVAGCDRVSSRGVLWGRCRSWIVPAGLAGNPEKRAGAISVPGCGMICFRKLLVCFFLGGGLRNDFSARQLRFLHV